MSRCASICAPLAWNARRLSTGNARQLKLWKSMREQHDRRSAAARDWLSRPISVPNEIQHKTHVSMITRAILPVLMLFVATPDLTALADAVTNWNSIPLSAIKADRTSPPQAARHLAILHLSIFDAFNGIGQNCESYFVAAKPPGVASKEAAIAAAAHKVLTSIYPAQ